jgi:hypothetical protein
VARAGAGGGDATGLLDVIIDQSDTLEWYRQELGPGWEEL